MESKTLSLTCTHSTQLNEQVMLKHKLIKSVIIINLSPPLHGMPSPSLPFSLSTSSEQTALNPLLGTGGNEFY